MIIEEAEAVDQAASGAVWVFEQGGLALLLMGLAVTMLGMAQARREGGGSRNVGFGIAMVVAASIALYLSVWMGGDPVGAAVNSRWMYPFVLSFSLLLSAAHLTGRKRQHKQRQALSAAQLQDLRYGRRADGRAGQPRVRAAR